MRIAENVSLRRLAELIGDGGLAELRQQALAQFEGAKSETIDAEMAEIAEDIMAKIDLFFDPDQQDRQILFARERLTEGLALRSLVLKSLTVH